MSKVATIVFAHWDVLDIVKRHLSTWASNTDFLLIVSPKDRPCLVSNVDCLTHSLNQHHGKQTLRRQQFAMKAALGYEADQYVFLEYDALMLQRPKTRLMIQGNLFNEHIFDAKNVNSHQCFLHFPWVFPSGVLKDFVKKIVLDPNDDTVHDVWMAQRLMELGVDVCNLLSASKATPRGLGEGFSKNTIGHAEDDFTELNLAIQKGAYAFHGVKTKSVFDAIVRSRIN